jgi:hypothetical protein
MAGHGGKREGSGRRTNAEKYSLPLAGANDRLARALPDVVEALLDLALGRTFAEKWAPAGTVTRKDVLRRPLRPVPEPGWTDADGNPCDPEGRPLPPPVHDDGIWLDPKEKPVVVDVLVYPHLPANELVMVSQVPIPPDAKVLAYIWDRLEGKPGQSVELTGEDGDAVRHAVHIYLPDNLRDTPVQENGGLIG